MLRALIVVPLITALTVVLAGPALLLGLLDRRGRWPHLIARVWAQLVLEGCGVRVRLRGEENLPAGPAVYAANHGSALDIPILFGHLPVDFRIMHKRSLSFIPFLGWYLHLGGHIAIDRSNPFKARKSLAAAAARIRGGTSVVVFPEGTRSRDGSVGPFKGGSFLLAVNAGVPVVPVSLLGVKRVVPRGVRTLRGGSVEVRVHPALTTAGREPGRAAALADEVRGVVARGCEEAET